MIISLQHEISFKKEHRRDSEFGILHTAMAFSSPEIVKLDAGVDPADKDVLGNEPIFYVRCTLLLELSQPLQETTKTGWNFRSLGKHQLLDGQNARLGYESNERSHRFDFGSSRDILRWPKKLPAPKY